MNQGSGLPQQNACKNARCCNFFDLRFGRFVTSISLVFQTKFLRVGGQVLQNNIGAQVAGDEML